MQTRLTQPDQRHDTKKVCKPRKRSLQINRYVCHPKLHQKPHLNIDALDVGMSTELERV